MNNNDELMKTSHSEVESFLLCERRHYYGYGLELQKASVADALVRGNLGHAGLAAYYQGKMDGLTEDSCREAAIAKVVSEVAEYDAYDSLKIAAEVINVLNLYFDNYSGDDYEILGVEKEFNIPVGDNFFIKMYVDLILRIPGEGVVFWDHKFVWDFFDPRLTEILPQLPKYMAAARMEGLSISGVWYNEIRTRETKDNKADPSERFRRTPFKLSTNRVVTTMREQIMAAGRIKELRAKTIEDWEQSVLRVASSTVCKTCSFLELCALDLKGEDKSLAIEYGYKPKGKRDPNG